LVVSGDAAGRTEGVGDQGQQLHAVSILFQSLEVPQLGLLGGSGAFGALIDETMVRRPVLDPGRVSKSRVLRSNRYTQLGGSCLNRGLTFAVVVGIVSLGQSPENWFSICGFFLASRFRLGASVLWLRRDQPAKAAEQK